MKLVKTEEAVGHMLCHDITQIIKGVTKDAVFRKGHIVTEEDISVLLSVGKENLYIWEKDETMMHENEAAEVLCQICKGDHMHRTEVKEGKIELVADEDGVLKIRRDAMNAVNSMGQMMIASRHGDFAVKKGDKIAGTRIIPLVIEKEKMEQVKVLAGEEPIFQVLPYKLKKAGVITTGNEVLKNRIQDTFTPVSSLSPHNIYGRQFQIDLLLPCLHYLRRNVFHSLSASLLSDNNCLDGNSKFLHQSL